MRQEVGLVESRPFWIATTLQAQQRPRQQQHGSQRKHDIGRAGNFIIVVIYISSHFFQLCN